MQFQRSSPWQKDRKNPGLQGINSWPIGRLQLISHRRISIGVLGHYWQLRMNSETEKAGGREDAAAWQKRRCSCAQCSSQQQRGPQLHAPDRFPTTRACMSSSSCASPHARVFCRSSDSWSGLWSPDPDHHGSHHFRVHCPLPRPLTSARFDLHPLNEKVVPINDLSRKLSTPQRIIWVEIV